MLVNIERLERPISKVVCGLAADVPTWVGSDPFSRSEDQGWQRYEERRRDDRCNTGFLIQFLLTALAICATFAALAETELGLDEQGALEAFNRAVHGCDTIQKLVLRVQDATKRLEIEQKLDLLQARLADLEAAFD